MGEQNVVLHNVGCIFLERLSVDWDFIIEKNVSWEDSVVLSTDLAIRHNVQKTCLTSSWSAHNISGLTWSREPWYTFEDRLSLHQTYGRVFFSFLLSCLDVYFEEDVLPWKLDGLFAKFLGLLN